MSTQKILGIVVVIAAIVGIVFGVTHSSPAPSQVQNTQEQALGGINPIFTTRFLTVGDVTSWFFHPPLMTATTTPCDITTPASTSTLVSWTLQVTTGTSTAGTAALATSTSANATTTTQQTFTIPASSQFSWVYRPTTSASSTMGPNLHLTLGVRGGPDTGFLYVGKCSAVFQVL